MAITQLDKMRIMKFFRERQMGEIYYDDLVKYMGKKSNVTDLEFTAFFANYIEDNLQKEHISLNLISKMVSALISFIGWLHEDDVKIDDVSFINRMHSLYGCYEQYLVKNGEERNSTLDELFPILDEKLKEFYPYVEVEEEIDSVEDVERLKKEIEELSSELHLREERIKELEKESKKKDKAIESRKKDITRLSGKLESSQKEQRTLNDKIKFLEGLVEELKTLIASLEDKLKDSDEKYAILHELKARIQNDYYTLKSTIKSLRSDLESKESEIIKHREEEKMKIVIPLSDDVTEQMNNRIEALIIRKMISGRNTVEELLEYLLQNGFSVSKDEIRRYLRNIKDKMNLEYKVSEDSILEDEDFGRYTIMVPENTFCYDLMVVSDFHLTSFDKEIVQDMELINDYCEKNGISMILNAGDFFSLNRTRNKRSISICKKLVEKIVTKYPSRNGIVHAVLGGNHDKELMEYVDDPLKTLESERDDFVNLGYGHCKISFGGTVSILDTIALHHPNRRYPEPVGNTYDTKKIQDSLNNYYFSKNMSNDDVYVDILGHIHKSGLDTENGICIVPSYRKDRVINGAWHVKIYFNENGHIDNIAFIPLIKQRKLVPTTEIGYKKQLIK